MHGFWVRHELMLLKQVPCGLTLPVLAATDLLPCNDRQATRSLRESTSISCVTEAGCFMGTHNSCEHADHC